MVLGVIRRGLESTEETQRFVYSLPDRLAADRGYLVVSYFIVVVLWRIGLLSDALQRAKRDLPEKEARFFGLSNVLMLLNGLLKYRHPEFNDQMLDEIRANDARAKRTFVPNSCRDSGNSRDEAKE